MVAWAISVALVAALSVYAMSYPLNHDVAWWLYVARSMLRGDALYRDLVEINPPLCAYLAMIPVFIAKVLHLDLSAASRGLTLVVCLTMVAWTANLASRLTGLRTPVAFALFSFTILGLAGMDWGQREHLMFALGSPFLVILAGRKRRRELRAREMYLSGVIAGVAFSLKPHFAVIWLALVVSTLLDRRDDECGVTIEIVVSAVVIMGYGLGVLVFSPEYLQLLVKAGALYAAFASETLVDVVAKPATVFLVGIGSVALGTRSRPSRGSLVRQYLVFSAVVWMIGVLQQKGWSYHFYPAVAATTTVASLLLIERFNRQPARSLARRSVAYATVFAVSALTAVVIGDRTRNHLTRASYREQLIETERKWLTTHDVRSMLMLSPYVSDGFPLVVIADLRWASPFPTLWWVQAAHGAGKRVDDYLPVTESPVEREFLDLLVHRIVAVRPDAILVDTARSPRFNGRPFPYLTYLRMNASFDELFSSYANCGRLQRFHVYCHNSPEQGDP